MCVCLWMYIYTFTERGGAASYVTTDKSFQVRG